MLHIVTPVHVFTPIVVDATNLENIKLQAHRLVIDYSTASPSMRPPVRVHQWQIARGPRHGFGMSFLPPMPSSNLLSVQAALICFPLFWARIRFLSLLSLPSNWKCGLSEFDGRV